MKPTYTFKFTPEILWAIFVAIVGAIATAVAAQGPTPPADMGAWAMIVLMAIARPVGGLILQMLFGKSTEPVTTDTVAARTRKGQ